MARITIWGDFKANAVDHLNLSGELQLLLNQSDINIVNFEAPVKSTGKPIRKSGPNIHQHTDAPQWLEDRGFNVISLANNHTMDYGSDGLHMTMESFKSAKVAGAGNWDNAYRMTVVNVEGLKIGILAGTHCEFGTLTDKDIGEGCAWCMSPEFERLIFNGGVDYLIVFNHGGVEYMDYPLPEWRSIYRKWIDMGADAVIASHPHVPQGWEMYKGKPICYSLGNFCFQKDKVSAPHWNESLCCILDINSDKEVSVKVRPVFYDEATQYINDNESTDFMKHMESLNHVLGDKSKYMSQINAAVMKLWPKYVGLLVRSGFIYPVKSLGLMKGVAEGFRKEHLYNCIQCESHRWAIERAMKLKYRIVWGG